MALLDILIAIIVVGVLLWIINTFIPMDHKIKKIFNLVVVIALIIWLLKVFGLFSYLMNIRMQIFIFVVMKESCLVSHKPKMRMK